MPLALLVLAIALVLASCSSLPPTHYYVVEIDPQASSKVGAAGDDPARAWTIGVRPFAVDSPYDQDRIVYRVGEGSAEVGFYAYHLWAAPLSSMLAAAVATGLEGADGVGMVEPITAGRTYRAILDGRVLAIEEIDLADRQVVRAEIELRLKGLDGAELWSDVVAARGETRTEEVGDIVEAVTVALGEALAAARQSLGAALAKAPAPVDRR